MYAESDVIVDIVRDNQSGLSFRIFEALGLQKNVITNNKFIETYDIYSFNKIILMNDFLKKNKIIINDLYYSNEIIYKYHISNWIKTVFQI